MQPERKYVCFPKHCLNDGLTMHCVFTVFTCGAKQNIWWILSALVPLVVVPLQRS